jgi:hypothetical protein
MRVFKMKTNIRKRKTQSKKDVILMRVRQLSWLMMQVNFWFLLVYEKRRRVQGRRKDEEE